MNQSFYTAAVGAHQQQRHMDVRGNNIANVNTYGFKAEKSRFEALMNRGQRGITKDLPTGVGTRMFMTSTDFNPGGVATTNRFTDYMIEGDGFFAIVDLATNDVTYTRSGGFSISLMEEETGEVDENGDPIKAYVKYLSDGEGRFVLSNQGDLIRVDDEQEMLPIGIFDFNNYNGMEHVSDTKFRNIEKNGDLYVGTGRLVQGALELSNVDLAEELTKVIEAQRAYSMALKMVQTSDEIETTINSLRG